LDSTMQNETLGLHEAAFHCIHYLCTLMFCVKICNAEGRKLWHEGVVNGS
jgi:hypothetical protein